MAGLGLSLKLIGAEKLIKALGSKSISEPLAKGIRQITLKMEGLTKQATPVDTGRLRSSITSEIAPTLGKVGTNVEYACVVGSRQQVYEPMRKTSANIGNYPYDTVLSKDGEIHQIIAKYRFAQNPIECVSIMTREKRQPVIITSGHLILIWREGKVIWEQACNIKLNDMVFGKRSHNAIIDNSNKEPYLCFCGNIFWVIKSILPFRQPKYCSPECRHKYGTHALNTGMTWTLSKEQKRFGEKNPQWRDGSRLKPYDNNFNGKLKAMVKERDGWQCQKCGNPFNLIVHHRDWDKMNSDIDNLVTLCQFCHGKLNHQDCELPEVNQEFFMPRKIRELKHFTIIRKHREKLPSLYDFTVKDENSFMVGGILVHNSFVEYGTQKMEARHMESTATKVLGKGMFTYALELLQKWLGQGEKDISKDIEARFD